MIFNKTDRSLQRLQNFLDTSLLFNLLYNLFLEESESLSSGSSKVFIKEPNNSSGIKFKRAQIFRFLFFKIHQIRVEDESSPRLSQQTIDCQSTDSWDTALWPVISIFFTIHHFLMSAPISDQSHPHLRLTNNIFPVLSVFLCLPQSQSQQKPEPMSIKCIHLAN